MYGVALSPDGKLVATADAGGTVLVADAKTGAERAELSTRPALAGSVAFTPDSRRLVIGSGNGRITVFDLERERVYAAFDISDAAIYALAVSPDGRRIAAGDVNGNGLISDLDGSQGLRFADAERINSAAFTPDGSGVLFTSSRDVAELRDARDGEVQLTLSGHGGPVSDAEMSPDGRFIATANRDGSAVLWDARTGRPAGDPVVPANSSAVIGKVAFVPGANAVVTAGDGGVVDAWDLDTRERIGSYRGQGGTVYGVDASVDGRLLATAAADGTARVWDFSQRLFTVPGAIAVKSVEFSPTGDRVVIADGDASVVNSRTGTRLWSVEGTKSSPITGAAMAPEGTIVATAGGGRVRFYDLDSGEEVTSLALPAGAAVPGLDWSTDGGRLLAFDPAAGLRVWSIPDGEVIGEIRPPRQAFDAALNADGSRVAIAGTNGVTIHDVESGERVRTLEGHTTLVGDVAYDGAGERIVTVSEDGTARVWNAATGEEELVLANDGQAVRAAAFDEDGSLVVTSSANGELRIWDAGSGLELARFAGANWKVALSPLGQLAAGALAQTDHPQTSIWGCDVCGLDLDGLERLAAERITRELTDAERERYFE